MLHRLGLVTMGPIMEPEKSHADALANLLVSTEKLEGLGDGRDLPVGTEVKTMRDELKMLANRDGRARPANSV